MKTLSPTQELSNLQCHIVDVILGQAFLCTTSTLIATEYGAMNQISHEIKDSTEDI